MVLRNISKLVVASVEPVAAHTALKEGKVILKCWEGNYNGNVQGLVAAYSLRAAAEIAGTTVYDFTQYWGRRELPTWPDFKPFTLYIKRFDSNDSWVAQSDAGKREGDS